MSVSRVACAGAALAFALALAVSGVPDAPPSSPLFRGGSLTWQRRKDSSLVYFTVLLHTDASSEARPDAKLYFGDHSAPLDLSLEASDAHLVDVRESGETRTRVYVVEHRYWTYEEFVARLTGGNRDPKAYLTPHDDDDDDDHTTSYDWGLGEGTSEDHSYGERKRAQPYHGVLDPDDDDASYQSHAHGHGHGHGHGDADADAHPAPHKNEYHVEETIRYVAVPAPPGPGNPPPPPFHEFEPQPPAPVRPPYPSFPDADHPARDVVKVKVPHHRLDEESAAERRLRQRVWVISAGVDLTDGHCQGSPVAYVPSPLYFPVNTGRVILPVHQLRSYDGDQPVSDPVVPRWVDGAPRYGPGGRAAEFVREKHTRAGAAQTLVIDWRLNDDDDVSEDIIYSEHDDRRKRNAIPVSSSDEADAAYEHEHPDLHGSAAYKYKTPFERRNGKYRPGQLYAAAFNLHMFAKSRCYGGFDFHVKPAPWVPMCLDNRVVDGVRDGDRVIHRVSSPLEGAQLAWSAEGFLPATATIGAAAFRGLHQSGPVFEWGAEIRQGPFDETAEGAGGVEHAKSSVRYYMFSQNVCTVNTGTSELSTSSSSVKSTSSSYEQPSELSTDHSDVTDYETSYSPHRDDRSHDGSDLYETSRLRIGHRRPHPYRAADDDADGDADNHDGHHVHFVHKASLQYVHNAEQDGYKAPISYVHGAEHHAYKAPISYVHGATYHRKRDAGGSAGGSHGGGHGGQHGGGGGGGGMGPAEESPSSGWWQPELTCGHCITIIELDAGNQAL